MSNIEVTVEPGPEWAASALINDDWSGLDDDDRETLEAWIAYAVPEGAYVVADQGEPYFSWACQYHGLPYSGGSLVDYVIHRPVVAYV